MKNKICFQITSEKRKEKVQKTINSFIDDDTLKKEYSQLYIFCLVKKTNYQDNFDTTKLPSLQFDKKANVWDFEELLKKIKLLDDLKIKEILEFIDKALWGSDKEAIRAERDEIKKLLSTLERDVFYAPFEKEDPIEMFTSIRRVRISLQSQGASYVSSKEVNEDFKKIQKTLSNIETEIYKKYPDIVELSTELVNERDTLGFYKRRTEAKQKLGDKYNDAILLMMGIRPEIESYIQKIQKRLDELTNQLN